jgi:hypothetical protein
MSEKLKTANIKKAITLLPMPKTYPPLTITVAVGKLKYTFEKIADEWHFVF